MPIERWLDNEVLGYRLHYREYYSVLKKDAMVSYGTKWMEFKVILLS